MAKYSLDEENKRKYETRARDWGERTKITMLTPADVLENGIDKTLNTGKFGIKEKGYTENNRIRVGTNKVNLEYINSDEYKRKFDNITNDKETNNLIYSKAVEILRSNNGTDMENTIIISRRKVIINKKGKKNQLGVSLSEKDLMITRNYKDLIGLHNHPTNLMPNGSDFNAAGYRKYKFGIIATHDGRLFKYSTGNKPFLPELLELE